MPITYKKQLDGCCHVSRKELCGECPYKIENVYNRLMSKNRYLKAGYTHMISWEEYSPVSGCYVDKKFPTVEAMVDKSLSSIMLRKDTRNVKSTKIEDNI